MCLRRNFRFWIWRKWLHSNMYMYLANVYLRLSVKITDHPQILQRTTLSTSKDFGRIAPNHPDPTHPAPPRGVLLLCPRHWQNWISSVPKVFPCWFYFYLEFIILLYFCCICLYKIFKNINICISLSIKSQKTTCSIYSYNVLNSFYVIFFFNSQKDLQICMVWKLENSSIEIA